MSPPATPSPSRRQVLCGLAVALAAPGALAACAAPESSAPAPSAPGSAPPPAAGDGVPLSQIPVGGGVIVERDPDPVLVVQPTAGSVKAYNATCPHAGTTVDPPTDGTIVCPNHFSQFDAATGAVRTGPATTGLAEVPVRVVDGVVQLA